MPAKPSPPGKARGCRWPACCPACAFNSVYFKTLETEAHRAGGRVGIPLAGDDADALALAAGLVRDAGFHPVLAGPLVRAREFDPGTPVYNTGMSGPDLARALGAAADPR